MKSKDLMNYELSVHTLSDLGVEQGVSPCSLCDLRDTQECCTVGIPKCTTDPARQYIKLTPIH